MVQFKAKNTVYKNGLKVGYIESHWDQKKNAQPSTYFFSEYKCQITILNAQLCKSKIGSYNLHKVKVIYKRKGI